MNSYKEDDGRYTDDAIPPYPMKGAVKMMVQHRSIGSPSTINVFYCYPSGTAPSSTFLAQRLLDLQDKWAFLRHTIIDQRTPHPKVRSRSTPWETSQVLFEDTYEPLAEGDPEAQVRALFEDALRKFQHSNEYNDGPLWAVRVYRSPKPGGREYVCTLVDHVVLDGRGALRLAKAVVAPDISYLPTEPPEYYLSVPPLTTGLPPWYVIVREVFKAMILPKLPLFISRWFGYLPTWPGKLQAKPIDSPWRTSLLWIPSSTVDRFKSVAKTHGLKTLNPAIYAVFCAAHWGVYGSPLALQPGTLKDVRKPTDPYCFGNYFTVLVSQTPLGPNEDLWEVARAYAAKCDEPGAVERGIDLIKLTELIPDGPFDPAHSPPAPPTDRLPKGDKRAHTKAESMALQGINKMVPPHAGSGVWSNMAYEALPEGAYDMAFGVSGNDTGQPFNCCTIGHEGGMRCHAAYSDGAAMTREQVGRLHANMKAIMERVADGKGPWDFASLNQ